MDSWHELFDNFTVIYQPLINNFSFLLVIIVMINYLNRKENGDRKMRKRWKKNGEKREQNSQKLERPIETLVGGRDVEE